MRFATMRGGTLTEQMRIDNNGWVGIGAIPQTKFEVQGTSSASYFLTGNAMHVGSYASSSYRFFVIDPIIGSTATGSFGIRSSNTVGSVASISATALTSGDVFKITVPASAAGNDAGGVLNVKNTSGVTMASLSFGGRLGLRSGVLSRGATSTCTGIAAPTAGCIDLAEEFPTTDANLEKGDIVSVDIASDTESAVRKSSIPYDKNILGIVSTKPGIVLSSSVYTGTAAESYLASFNKSVIALAGRVPINITFENGDIKKGDYLTSSTTLGKAMRASKEGKVIGMALESATKNSGKTKVMTFVNPHWVGKELDATLDPNSPNLLAKFFDFLKDSVLSVKKIIADAIETKKVITNKLEIKDSITGEIYCVSIANGEWLKTKGECVSSTPTPSTTPLPVFAPTPTATPAPSPTPVSTPIPSPSLLPTPSPAPSLTPAPSPSAIPTSPPISTPSPTVSGSPAPTPSKTPSPSP